MAVTVRHFLECTVTGTIPSGICAACDELMKWERIPLSAPLKVGRAGYFAGQNVRAGFPPALNGKLRVQSTGGAVYLKADSAFPQTRLQLQDVETGNYSARCHRGEQGPSEPVRIVYDGEVSTVSQATDLMKPASSSGKTHAVSRGYRDRMTVRRPVVSRFGTVLPAGMY